MDLHPMKIKKYLVVIGFASLDFIFRVLAGYSSRTGDFESVHTGRYLLIARECCRRLGHGSANSLSRSFRIVNNCDEDKSQAE